jgi:predicted nucleic acid-binding protein
MIMADTSVWIDYFNGTQNRHTIKLDNLLVNDIVVIGDIILAEILQGFRLDRDFIRAKVTLDVLECFPIVGKENAIKSAENFRFLRKKGITVRKTTDMLIGTFCITNNIPLLYSDRDFDPLKENLGLRAVL